MVCILYSVPYRLCKSYWYRQLCSLRLSNSRKEYLLCSRFSVLSLNLHFVLPLLTLWHKSNWVSLWEAAVAHAVFVNLRPTEEVVSLYKQAYYTKTQKLWIECLKEKLLFVHFEVVHIMLPLTFVLLLNWGT